MKYLKTMSAIAAAAALAGGAHAEGLYVSGSVGLSTQSDSDNSGSTGAFRPAILVMEQLSMLQQIRPMAGRPNLITAPRFQVSSVNAMIAVYVSV